MITAMLLLASLTAAEPLPEQLKFLEASAANQQELVDAIRNFDKTQSSFIAVELRLAERDIEQNKLKEAKQKQQDAKERTKLVRQAYEYGLERYSKDGKLKNYYGELLYDKFNEQAGALKCWQEATALSPDLSAPYNNLAIHYCHMGDYRLGIQYYDQAMELEPDNPDYLFNVAQVYLVNFPQVQEIRGWSKPKIFNAAMRLSKKASELLPNDFDLAQDYAVNFFAADNFGVTPNWGQAARAWQRARALAASADVVFYTWLNEGRVWLRDGNKTKAVACLEKAIELRPNDEVAKKLIEQAKTAGNAKKTARDNSSGE
jgi:tetratricopeptide (TPR) repeat protein